MEKNKTYMDKLMTEKDFREKFDQEYQNLCIAGTKNGIMTQSDCRADLRINFVISKRAKNSSRFATIS